jgi:phosphoserine phosphatase
LITIFGLLFGLTIFFISNHSISNIQFSLAFAHTNEDTIYDSSMINVDSLDVKNEALSSWNDGIMKNRIIDFVKNVTDGNSDYYIPSNDRIAVFDNDGTLWSEKPFYFQGFFSFDRFKELVVSNPNIRQDPKIKDILDKNFTNFNELTEKDVMDILLITHSNISQTEFNKMVVEWSKTAKHPETKQLFVNMVYQPMIELLNFLKDNQFKIFIVSGGGVDFIREALSSVYGIPPEQIIGSSIKYEYIDRINANESTNIKYNDTSFILRESMINSINNDYEKPANIQLHIGKVPVIAVGNSDGDLQMLEYVYENNEIGQSLPILIHHDDEKREYSYDKGAENILKDAKENNWLIISMKKDFKRIYP